MCPEWGFLAAPLSIRTWAAQLTWVDPISIASKKVLPLVGAPTRAAWLVAPAAWLLAALALAIAATFRTGGFGSARRGWTAAAALLLAGGLVAPDTLGPSHGHYLPQRIVLLGLIALVPVLELGVGRWTVRGCTTALVVALAVQSAVVWDHALAAQRTAGTFWRARRAVGQRQRVATLLVRLQGRSRANPLLHADCLLGVGTGNVIWSNYETRHYYFPVQFRGGFDRPDAGELEAIDLLDDPCDAPARAARWERLLARHHRAIDVLAVWGSEPRLDAINGRWFHPVARDGPLQILRHR
jgi:hypothetical protein